MKSNVTLRITAPTIVISVFLLAVGIVAAWHVHSVDQSNSETLDLNVTSVRAAQEFEIGVRDMRTHWNNYLLTGDRKHLDEIPALREHADKALADAGRLATTETEQVLIAQMKQGYQQFLQELESSRKGQPVTAANREKIARMFKEEILNPAHEYLNINMVTAQQTNNENKRLANRTVGVLLFLGISGAIAGLLAGLALAQHFRRSIVKLSLTVQDAAGKLNEVADPITLSSGDELKDLDTALGTISERISTVVRQLHQSQREVLRAEQLAALGQLAAGLAHELRNPLSAIKILVQSAAAQGEAGSLRGKDLSVLEKEISRLEGSIQNFLDFARPPQLEHRLFEMRQVLEQTLDLVAARAKSQSVRLERSLPAEPVHVNGDREHVRQIVLNLLLNALDVLPHGGAVAVHLTLANAGLTLRITDSGPGLPADLGTRIFDPFVSTKETGLGLGLSICKRIIEAHGGAIAADNRPEGGAMFTVHLPLAPVRESAAA